MSKEANSTERALKLALEALENSIDLVEEDYANAVNLYGKYPSRAQRLIGMETMRDDHRKAITALREALAEQPAPVAKPHEQEPVAWEYGDEIFWHDSPDINDHIRATGKPLVYNDTSLPAQRMWVGLTDVERHECTQFPFSEMNHRAIEAKLKEKNT